MVCALYGFCSIYAQIAQKSGTFIVFIFKLLSEAWNGWPRFSIFGEIIVYPSIPTALSRKTLEMIKKTVFYANSTLFQRDLRSIDDWDSR